MEFGEVFLESKSGPELVVESIGVVANDVQAAASGWHFRTKGSDDHMAPGLYSTNNLPHVGSAVLHLSQKMKNCPVMPYVVLV